MATLHMEGDVEAWYFSYRLTRRLARWEELCEELVIRFEDDHSESVVAEFKMLTQQGTVKSLRNLGLMC